VAWTSDAWGRWAVDWIGWSEFARFWGQAVRWTIVEGATGSLETQVTLDSSKGVLRLSVEALDSRGNYINNLDLSGSLVSPELQQQDISLAQVAPGLYQTELRLDETGAYLLRVLGADEADQLVSSATRGFVVSYSPEYAAEQTDPTLMANLAALGGGQILPPANPGAVFAHTLPPVSGARPLWPLLLTVFVFLLPVDVGLRRVIVGREELLKLAARLRSYLSQPAAEPAVSQAAASSASSLLSIKEKGREAQSPGPDRPPLIINQPAKPDEPVEETPPETDTGDRMSRLLKAKRKAKK
jgi:hypothetical protein